MYNTRVARGWRYPVAVWVMLLTIVFLAEYAVMLLLPWILPQRSSHILESAVDSIILTFLLAPVLWWTIVRPLREVIRLRTQFLADLFAQIERDRRQTAYELHDGVGQSLTLLISGLRTAKASRENALSIERVDEFQRLAENALMEVRRLSLVLRPSLLDDLGLVPALERLVQDIRNHQKVPLSLDVDGMPGIRLPEQVATAVFRIVQEALANVLKHSGAQRIAVILRMVESNLIVEVQDDGCGIEPARLSDVPAGHLGLRGMRERAALLGGEFVIDSAPEQGTRIVVTIPTKGTQRG